MKTNYFTLLLLLFSLLNLQCKSPTSSEHEAPVINGKVIDSHGNPVENVDVHYIFTVPPASLGKSQNMNTSVMITFGVSRRSMVVVEIFRYFRNDSLGRIVHDTLNAGQYSYQLDISKFTNGLYVYRITIDTLKVERVFFCLDPDLATLLQTVPLVRTNANGEFTLPYQLLGFNYPLVRTSASGAIIDTTFISKSIQLVLSKAPSMLIKQVTIDSQKETDVTLTLVSP